MLRTKLIIGTIIILFSSLSAQENLPVRFSDDVVKWSELSWIDANKPTDQKFNNRLPPIIIQDTIYTFENYIGKTSTGINLNEAGYLIKKINLITGEKYWELYRMYKNNAAKRKAISHPSFINNMLYVSLYDEAQSPGSDWGTSYPAHIVIDPRNGYVVDSNYVDRSDTSLPKFRSVQSKYEDHSRFYFKNNTYINTSLQIIGSEPIFIFGIVNTTLNLNGHIIKSDTSKSLSYNFFLKEFYSFENSFNGLDVILICGDNQWKNKEFRFLQYDENLDIMTDIDISAYFTDSIQYTGFYNRADNYFIIGSLYEDLNRREREYNDHLFNLNGEFVDKSKFILRDGIDNGIAYGWVYPIVDKVNQRILVTRSKQDAKNKNTYFELFASDGDDVQLVKRIEVMGINDHFRTKYGRVMDNGDVLLYIEQFAWEDQNVRWYSWIMLDGQKMNIISDTKEVERVTNKIKLYPNPTSEIVNIEGLDSPASVIITDINGLTIKKINNVLNEIIISDLPSGLYFFDISNKTINERHKIIKIE